MKPSEMTNEGEDQGDGRKGRLVQMKNIEKYTNTKDALEAYNSRELDNVPFDEWLNREYEEPCVQTLLESAKEVVKAWYAKIPEGSIARVGQSIVRLSSAIEREMRKPVRNFDKYKTAEEAYDAFMKFCKKTDCYDCSARKIKIHDCPLAWIYEEAAKEEAR